MKNWRNNLPKKRYQQILCGLVAVLVLVLVILSLPKVQKKIVVAQAAKYTESFRIDYVHLLPWSVELRGVDIAVPGAFVQLGQLETSFCLTKLLWKIIHVKDLSIVDAKVTVRETNSAPSTERFPGVFSLIDRGFRLTLENIAAHAQISLPDETQIDVSIPTGNFAANDRGEMRFQAHVNQPAAALDAETSGLIAITQSEAQGIEEIFTELSLSASLGADEGLDPTSVQLAIDAVLTPWSETRVIEDQTEAERYFIGDILYLNVTVPNREAKGVNLAANMKFNAEQYTVSGDYDLSVAAEWLEAIIGNESAPLMSESGNGSFTLDLAELNLEFDYAGDTSFTTLERLLNENPALPASLRLSKAISLSSDLENATIESLETGLSNPDGTSLFSLGLTDPIAVTLADPTTLLTTDKTIAKFELAKIPIEWVGGLVPEASLKDGQLSGTFVLETKDGVVQLMPTAPLQLSATKILAKELPEQLISVAMEPHVYYTKELLRADVSNLSLVIAEEESARLDVAVKLPFDDDNPPMEVSARGSLALDRIKQLSAVAPHLEQYPTPDGLSGSLDAQLLVFPESVAIQSALIDIKRNDSSIVKLKGLQAFSVGLGEEPVIDYKKGPLARLEINDIDLKWANPYLGELTVDGELADATFELKSAGEGGFVLTPAEPVSVRRLDVTKDKDKLVQDLRIDISPSLELLTDSLRLEYSNLSVGARGDNVVRSKGAIALDRTPEGLVTDKIRIDGATQLNINELSNFPAVSALVDYEFGKTAWRSSLDYKLIYSPEEIVLNSITAKVFANKAQRVTVSSNRTTKIRPQIGANEPLAQHVIGDIAVSVNSIKAEEIQDLIPLGGFNFKAIDGTFLLESDGAVLSADISKPLKLSGASLSSEGEALVNEFNFSVAGKLTTAGSDLNASLSDIKLMFVSDSANPALKGDISFKLQPEQAIPIITMSANVGGDIPILLRQPAIMPGHSLSAGSYSVNAKVNPSAEISGNAKLGNLVAAKPLAVSEFTAEITGKMAETGKGFYFQMPISGAGKTGQTDGLLTAQFAPQKEKASILSLVFNSEQFFLNDLLASVGAIAQEKPKKAQEKSDATDEKLPVVINDEPDERAFWDVLPLNAVLTYEIKQLYYTDYVIFDNVSGSIMIQPEQLDITELSAFFHDSPMKFNGALKFLAKTPSPYDVKLLGSVTDFNLNQFFTELVPGVKPRVEGLFGVSIDVFGTSPNMGQFRNNLFFNNRLQSREGLFRPLPPDSGLLIGASDVLGFVGEGLSYMPTGGFGAGALSRLVNYIKEIDYDLIDIHLTRGDDRDIVINKFLVQSPTVRLRASGGIDYEYGKDVLDSPLTLDAQLNMSGKGAAILYSMDLLENEEDNFGYSHGPKFAIRGTPNAPSSNFAEIISAGAKGTIAGGVTRPISGLIGNIKHRWFGDETKPPETDVILGKPTPQGSPNKAPEMTSETPPTERNATE